VQVGRSVGLTWPRWQRAVAEVERLGFSGLYLSDHFTNPDPPPDSDSLETVVALTYLADHSRSMRFGPLVAPLSFRDPVMLARQALALDDLSGGRMVLGIGAGWMEHEHTTFGYDLGDARTRMGRLEEGLQIIARLCRDDAPVTFAGRFFHLHDARLLPRPRRPGGPRLLLGGNGLRRSLPLAARYGDIWNGSWLSVAEFREHTGRLDELLHREGRPLDSVQRSLIQGVVCWKDEGELERRMAWARQHSPDLNDQTPAAVLEEVSQWWHPITGSPSTVIERIKAYEAAGLDELIVQWFDVTDLEGLQVLAENVLPHLV
jgi:alkanesulfonate monooxygenase SsuD/methylene tetrahydromethanopterin reductase-like flavin-dependent oxidoreductase (luciferase family)